MPRQPLRARARALLRRDNGAEVVIPSMPISGRARLGRKTKDLVKRLGPEDIAIIDHPDLDRIAAEDLARSGVRAVVNVSPSTTGRYPNSGPLVLARSGVRLLDVPGAPLFDELSDGEEVTVAGSELRRGDEVLARGEALGLATVQERLERQRERIDEAIRAFALNTMEHVRDEGDVLLGDLELPHTRTEFWGRHALIVVRGTTYRNDLRALRAYIQDVRPVLVGVDGGADAIVEEGFRPDMILGDMDSVSDETLRSGAEVMVHGYRDGRAPGAERLDELGVDYSVVPAIGTSQDVAMLLAYENGAELIVSVGAHFNLIEFLDKNRAGMSSTFLTRLRIGEKLVDAKGVSSLYNPGVSGRLLLLLLVVAVVLIAVVVMISSPLRELADLIWLKIELLLDL